MIATVCRSFLFGGVLVLLAKQFSLADDRPVELNVGQEAPAFSARTDAEEKGVEVVGVSGDSVEIHARFRKVRKLNFTLLSDEEGAIAKKFGVPFLPLPPFKLLTAFVRAIELHDGMRASYDNQWLLDHTGQEGNRIGVRARKRLGNDVP